MGGYCCSGAYINGVCSGKIVHSLSVAADGKTSKITPGAEGATPTPAPTSPSNGGTSQPAPTQTSGDNQTGTTVTGAPGANATGSPGAPGTSAQPSSSTSKAGAAAVARPTKVVDQVMIVAGVALAGVGALAAGL